MVTRKIAVINCEIRFLVLVLEDELCAMFGVETFRLRTRTQGPHEQGPWFNRSRTHKYTDNFFHRSIRKHPCPSFLDRIRYILQCRAALEETEPDSPQYATIFTQPDSRDISFYSMIGTCLLSSVFMWQTPGAYH